MYCRSGEEDCIAIGFVLVELFLVVNRAKFFDGESPRSGSLGQTQVIRFRRPELNQSPWNRELNPSLWNRQTNKMSDEVEEKVGRAYQSFGLAAAGT